jgi:hypothetical protein
MMRLEDGALTGYFVCLAGSKCRTAERGEYFCVGCVNFWAFRHPVGRRHLQLAHDFLRPVPRQAAQSPLHDQSFPSEWCVALCTAYIAQRACLRMFFHAILVIVMITFSMALLLRQTTNKQQGRGSSEETNNGAQVRKDSSLEPHVAPQSLAAAFPGQGLRGCSTCLRAWCASVFGCARMRNRCNSTCREFAG